MQCGGVGGRIRGIEENRMVSWVLLPAGKPRRRRPWSAGRTAARELFAIVFCVHYCSERPPNLQALKGIDVSVQHRQRLIERGFYRFNGHRLDFFAGFFSRFYHFYLSFRLPFFFAGAGSTWPASVNQAKKQRIGLRRFNDLGVRRSTG